MEDTKKSFWNQLTVVNTRELLEFKLEKNNWDLETYRKSRKKPNIILTFALVIVVTRCRPLKFHIQRIIDNRWDMEVNDSGGRGHISPPTETLLDVKSWTCCLPHERTGRDGVTKVHPASTTITRVIWKTCIEYYLYKVTLINWVESYIGLNHVVGWIIYWV